MLKIIAIMALISSQVNARFSIEDSLMYQCRNAALALGGYDENYVDINIDFEKASESDIGDFESFTFDFLNIKEVKYYGNKATYVVRAASDSLWVDVAILMEAFIDRNGFYGSCHLEL